MGAAEVERGGFIQPVGDAAFNGRQLARPISAHDIGYSPSREMEHAKQKRRVEMSKAPVKHI